MTRKQRAVLQLIAASPGIGGSEIAMRLGISLPSAYQRVWQLQRNGFVTRRGATRCSLTLTDKGKEAMWPWLLVQGDGGLVIIAP